MPTYHYRCTKCGHSYERFQKISDPARPRCPECRSRGERVISGGAGIHFKGSGFYITDYGKSGSKATADRAEKSEKKKKKKADKAGDAGAKSSKKKAGDS